MNRKYFEVGELVRQHPGYSLYIIMTPTGRIINWHISQPEPEGKFTFLGGWE